MTWPAQCPEIGTIEPQVGSERYRLDVVDIGRCGEAPCGVAEAAQRFFREHDQAQALPASIIATSARAEARLRCFDEVDGLASEVRIMEWRTIRHSPPTPQQA